MNSPRIDVAFASISVDVAGKDDYNDIEPVLMDLLEEFIDNLKVALPDRTFKKVAAIKLV